MIEEKRKENLPHMRDFKSVKQQINYTQPKEKAVDLEAFFMIHFPLNVVFFLISD